MIPFLSILIASMAKRKRECDRLMRFLLRQLDGGMPVEVLVNDAEPMSRGAKRQAMLQEARGDYVAFVDDDDLVADDYLVRVLNACAQRKDCCSLEGVITLGMGTSRPFYHSLKYDRWFEDQVAYYRTPNHLNAVRRDLALQAGFRDMAYGEDLDYSARLYPLLRTEAQVTGGPLYHYFAGDEVRSLSSTMRVCFKWPTRARPKVFARTMEAYLEKLSRRNPFCFVVSVDEDDETREEIQRICEAMGKNFRVEVGPKGRTKIQAINADLRPRDFDVLVVVADDMVPKAQDFDEWIVADMARSFPSLDGMILYDDGLQEPPAGKLPIATMPVMGRRFYEELGHVYHPAYQSLFCDNELTEVAEQMGAAKHVRRLLIRHEWIGLTKERDALLQRNEAWWATDKATYLKRKAEGFPEEPPPPPPRPPKAMVAPRPVMKYPVKHRR